MAHQIVPATEETVAEIEIWLDEEEREYNGGEREIKGFRCNWDSLIRRWREGTEQIDVLLVDGQAVGFLNETSILEIHPNHRSNGYGQVLAALMDSRAFDEGYSVIEITIAPETAESFWVLQGFKPDHAEKNYHNELHAFKTLLRPFHLGEGERVPVVVEFYDEKKRDNGEPPFVRFEGNGERLSDGSIQLPERVHGTDCTKRNNIENHVRIVVAGQEIYFGRSKYGGEYGTQKDPRGAHYIDRITGNDQL